jgi:hypothetical protein
MVMGTMLYVRAVRFSLDMLFKTQSASVYGIPLGLKAGLVGRPLNAGFRITPPLRKGYLPDSNDCQKVNPTTRWNRSGAPFVRCALDASFLGQKPPTAKQQFL